MADFFGRDPSAWLGEARLAFAFLTRLPFRSEGTVEPGALAQAGWAFPLVGIAVGVTGAIVFALTDRLGLPVTAMALLAVGATVLMTGGLHEDGLADTADGFGGGAEREQVLDIMRDSRSGAFGVLALIFSVGLRVAALAALPDAKLAAGALIAAHGVSRGLLPPLMHYLDPARSDGLGAEAGRPGAGIAGIAAAIAVILSVLCLDLGRGLVAVILAALAVAALGLLARRRIGGSTGDVLGAAQQVGEIVMLLAASV